MKKKVGVWDSDINKIVTIKKWGGGKKAGKGDEEEEQISNVALFMLFVKFNFLRCL